MIAKLYQILWTLHYRSPMQDECLDMDPQYTATHSGTISIEAKTAVEACNIMLADIHRRGETYRTKFRQEYLAEIQVFPEDGTDVLLERHEHIRNGGMRHMDVAEFRRTRLSVPKNALMLKTGDGA